MRIYALAIAAAAILAFPASAFSQAVEIGAGRVDAEGLQHGRSAAHADCRELRKACLTKEELYEQGQGNCRRYRQTCGLE